MSEQGWDKTKLRVTRRPRGGLGDVFAAFFGGEEWRQEFVWCVAYWDARRWHYRECANHHTAVCFAHAVAAQTRKAAAASGTYSPALAADVVAREWRNATTLVAVANR